jgi:hypothetical protein
MKNFIFLLFCLGYMNNALAMSEAESTSIIKAPMEWQDIRIAWDKWQEIVDTWKKWEEDRAAFIKENPDAVFTSPKPNFPSIGNIVATLNKNDFLTDSEDSILFLALDYTHERGKRVHITEQISPKDWESLWKSIQWNAISNNYFLNIHDYIKHFNNNELNTFYDAEKKRREEGGEVTSGTRSKIIDPHKAMIKCVFPKVFSWGENDKYYSKPVLINGYKLSYFLQRQIISKHGEPDVFGLGGYLKVSLGPNGQRVSLPLAISTALLLPPANNPIIKYNIIPGENRIIVMPSTFSRIRAITNNDLREYSTMRVLFSHTYKSIGGQLSLKHGESWEKIISGEVPFVINNTISVFIDINFEVDANSVWQLEDPLDHSEANG